MTAFSDAAARLKKPRPRLLNKREAKANVSAEDRAENEKVRHRSGGQCERVEVLMPMFMFNAKTMASEEPALVAVRCRRRAEGEPHHLIYGIGRRNVGRSIKAEHKLATCQRCHSEIHGAVLKPINDAERYDAATVRFERVR